MPAPSRDRCYCKTPRLVKLIDGDQACSCSEAWRAECEAREIAALYDPTSRMLRLRGVRNARGIRAENQLDALVAKLLKARRRAPIPSQQTSLW